MAGYTPGVQYGTDPTGQAAPTGAPALDATTLANLGLSQAEAQGVVMTANTPDPAVPGTFFQPLHAGQMGPPTASGNANYKTTVGAALQQWYALDSDQIEGLQKQLWDAGLYPRSMYAKGQEPAWGDPFSDAQGFSAYRTLLRRASTANKPIGDILSQTAGSAQQKLNTGFSPVLTNPDDLRAIIKAGAPTILGQKISDAEVEQIVSKYQAADYNAKFAQFQANSAGGATVASPNPTDFVKQQLEQLHPDQAAATQFNTEANSFLKAASAPSI